jgi:hypothetical protein
VADQITIRQAETQTSSHTAGFEAWLRSRGGASGAAAVYTADTIAEQFGVVKDSYTTVPLARPRSVAAAVCKGPGAPLQQVQLITQQLPLELEWGQVGWSRLAANPCNAAAHCPLCMWRVSSTACRLGGWVLAAARTMLGHSCKPNRGGGERGAPTHAGWVRTHAWGPASRGGLRQLRVRASGVGRRQLTLAPPPTQVCIDIKLAPITPSDIYSVRLGGLYGDDQAVEAPFTAGHECVAVVAQVRGGGTTVHSTGPTHTLRHRAVCEL